MAEDKETLNVRERVIKLAREQIGSHYVLGGDGSFPGGGHVKIRPNDDTKDHECYFAAQCSRVCSGRHGHKATHALPHGDPANKQHLANPQAYAWFRMIKFKHWNPLWCEYCLNKRHFDCSGFVNWCLRSACPKTFARRLTIKTIREMSEVINANGVSLDDLCVADILVRRNDGHIGFAVGNQSGKVVQAEYEATGVVLTNVGHWQQHVRLPKEIWQRG